MAQTKKNGDSVEVQRNNETDFVTGANGRLGRELVKMLLKKGDTVRALVKRKDMVLDLPPGVIPYIGDISDTKVLSEATNGADNVFHLAAIVNSYKFTTEEILKVNVEGTRNLLEASEANRIKHFLFTSTIDVYGNKRKEILREDSKPVPTDRYGHSKLLAEQAILRYRSTVPSTVLRLSTIYGPGFEGPFFKIFKAIKEGKAFIVGEGKNHLTLIHIYDTLQAIFLAKAKNESLGRTYNVSDGNPYTQEYLFNLAADLLKVDRPKRHVPELLVKIIAKNRGLDSDELRFITSNRNLDTSRIREELGFKPIVSIEKGGEDLIALFKKKNN